MKNYLYFIPLMCLFGCEPEHQPIFVQYSGETMGTYYQITFAQVEESPDHGTIERWLLELNRSLSTYDPGATISIFNQSKSGISHQTINNPRLSSYFFDNVVISTGIFHESQGNFDPTVMPLVNYWGFGYDKQKTITQIDTQRVDSLKAFVGFDKMLKLNATQDSLYKVDFRCQLDFSAVAKGYAIDVIGQFLEDSFSIHDYLVDIGGEARAKGTNREGNSWRIGINEPVENGAYNHLQFIIELQDRSIATSGNYRNYYEFNGQKISHTISPKTGFFERNDLLSASIITKDCAIADGFATACMAMGYEPALKMVEANNELEAILIYIDSNNEIKHYITPGLTEFVSSGK